jgi:hypothetical protein
VQQLSGRLDSDLKVAGGRAVLHRDDGNVTLELFIQRYLQRIEEALVPSATTVLNGDLSSCENVKR